MFLVSSHLVLYKNTSVNFIIIYKHFSKLKIQQSRNSVSTLCRSDYIQNAISQYGGEKNVTLNCKLSIYYLCSYIEALFYCGCQITMVTLFSEFVLLFLLLSIVDSFLKLVSYVRSYQLCYIEQLNIFFFLSFFLGFIYFTSIARASTITRHMHHIALTCKNY